jgi:hypothetical protein
MDFILKILDAMRPLEAFKHLKKPVVLKKSATNVVGRYILGKRLT